MIIRRMTASFGRLEKESLTLQDGLNIIHAPNEWGKSTWCAFLRCMLYGVDTAQREKAGFKPDKLRYAPWSGMPMAGIMDIYWQGEEIRLLRETRLPSAPMREFNAVYTNNGQTVSGITGSTAGELLTGVSEEVFRRTAFLAQGGLSVSIGSDLEKRITGLVTAGEEDASYTEASERLRTWQRRRRWRNKGRLPEVEEELLQIRRQLASMESLRDELAAVEEEISLLEDTLTETRQKQQTEQFNRREEALVRLEKAQTRQQKLEETALLRRREAEERIEKLKESPFAGQKPELAKQRVETDIAAAEKEKAKPRWGWLIPVLLALGAVFCTGSLFHEMLLYAGILFLSLSALSGIVFGSLCRKRKRSLSPVFRAWDVSSPEELRTLLEAYSADWNAAGAAARLAKQVQQEAENARMECKSVQQQVLTQLDAEGDSTRLLHQTRQQLQQLRENKAALKTRLNMLGDPLVLGTQLRQLREEKVLLEEEYEALELAQQELEAANQKLRAEFSPRLAHRTAYWLSRLTGGRYCEVTLNRELQAMLQRKGDMLPRESICFSQGTLDQLYLALRLALCELVLPGEEPCPLVLDDALVTFDDERLGYAMEALEELGKNRQILLFTCQDREERYRNRGGEL